MSLKNKELIVYGAGYHATSVLNVAFAAGFNVLYIVDRNLSGNKIYNIDVVAELPHDLCLAETYHFIAIGDNYRRRQVHLELIDRYVDLKFATLVHPSAVISIDTKLGFGTVVMPGVLVGPSVQVGDHAILNTGAIIDHGCILSNFVSLAPGVTLGGNVEVGDGSAILINASIKHQVSIGENVVVGGGAVVLRDVANNSLIYGNPARVIGQRNVDDKYL